jgi:hypothetical protein
VSFDWVGTEEPPRLGVDGGVLEHEVSVVVLLDYTDRTPNTAALATGCWCFCHCGTPLPVETAHLLGLPGTLYSET